MKDAPDRSVDSLMRLAREARDRRDFVAAHALLDKAERLCPGNHDIIHNRAKLAEVKGDNLEAEQYWRQFVGTDPTPIWWALTSLGRCAYLRGDGIEGAKFFAQARSQNPQQGEVLIEHVKVLRATEFKHDCADAVTAALDARDDWHSMALWEIGVAAIGHGASDSAIECAKRLRETADARVSNEFLGKLRWFFAEADPSRLPEIEALDLAPSNLMMRFESLGGDYPGCEIGLIQRKFGAEPIGLLRWTTITPDMLISALACRFEGVGSPEQTEIRAVETGDYKTMDRRFGMDMMTFVKVTDLDAETMHRKTCQRLRFLRGKLISDLSVGEKTFIYRSYADKLSMDDMVVLKKAMSAYGRNRLLYVRPADSEHPSGTVDHVADGLMIGRVARFSREPVRELFLDGWLEMLEAAT
jgi:tetratricopeptide (TPR) repeat protein